LVAGIVALGAYSALVQVSVLLQIAFVVVVGIAALCVLVLACRSARAAAE
jgi:hypothetical protein